MIRRKPSTRKPPATRLGRRDIEQHLPLFLADGEQVYVNHDKCPDGADIRRRLAIRKDGRRFILYCHKCGHSGVVQDDARSMLPAPLLRPSERSDFSPTDWQGWISARSQWPAEALQWVNACGLTDEEQCEAGIAFDPATGRVVLPIWEAGVLRGYLLRRLGPGTGAKYISRFPVGVPTMWHNRQGNNTLIVVEDYMSALKAKRAADSLALFGTKLPPFAVLGAVQNHYHHIRIMLDNDNPQVRRRQQEVKMTLALFCPDVQVVRVEKDPKYMTTSELRSAIK